MLQPCMQCLSRYSLCCAVCSNKLTDLPPELARLEKLRVVRLKYNSFVRVPEVLTRLPALEVLELSGNQLSSWEDKVLAALKSLR